MITDRIDPPDLLKIPEIVNVSVSDRTRIIHISGQTAVGVHGLAAAQSDRHRLGLGHWVQLLHVQQQAPFNPIRRQADASDVHVEDVGY